MAKTAVIRKSATATTYPQPPQDPHGDGREEKIFIYSSTRVPGHATAGSWIVAAPLKPVYRGQRVTWRVLDDNATLRLELPTDTFETKRVNGNSATAMVKGDAPSGMRFYDAYVNDQLAIGGSSPGVIVDP